MMLQGDPAESIDRLLVDLRRVPTKILDLNQVVGASNLQMLLADFLGFQNDLAVWRSTDRDMSLGKVEILIQSIRSQKHLSTHNFILMVENASHRRR
nr:hypothetical protein [Rhodopirellula sp. SM50]